MAAELPIFVEGLSTQYTQSFRATATDGLEHFPATYETVWDPADLPPPQPPAGLAPNGLPISNVQRAVVSLQPGPRPNVFLFLAATPPVVLPPPLEVTTIDRVIPGTWGSQALVPGAYQQRVENSSGAEVPYAETKWVVDGVNHFLEFPYGTPAGFLGGGAPPALHYYRYTGGVAGSGGGSGGGTVVGGANEGGFAEVLDTAVSTPAVLAFRTLRGTTNGVTVTQGATEITVDNTLTGANLGPGDADVFDSKVGNLLQFRSLVGGGITVISEQGGTILIDGQISMTNKGTGAQVRISPFFPTLYDLRTFLGTGNGITVTQGALEITIDNTLTGTNLGGGAGLFDSKAGALLQFKSLVAGANISLTPGAATVTIAATGVITALANLGAGAQVYDTGTAASLRTLLGTANGLTVTQNPTTVTIDNTLTGANLGAGDANIFDSKVGNLLQFKSLVGAGVTIIDEVVPGEILIDSRVSMTNKGTGAQVRISPFFPTLYDLRTFLGTGNGITVTQGALEITIDNTLTGTNLGGGAGLFDSKAGALLQFKSLVAGANISLTPGAATVTVAATGVVTALANLGAGAQVYDTGTAASLRTLLGTANGLTVTQNPTTVTIDNTLSGTNLGAGEQLFISKLGALLRFRTLLGTGNGLTVTTTAGNTITIDNTLTGANLGGGAGLFDSKSGALLQFKSLVAGSGMAVLPDVPALGEITIGLAQVPGTLDLYVNAVTGDDILGSGSPGSPFQTLQRAFSAIREVGWETEAYVNVEPSVPPLALQGEIPLTYGELGAQAKSVVVRGAPRVTVLADTVTAVTVDPASKLMTVSGAAGPYPPSYAGLVVRFTTGALAAYALPNAVPPAVVEAEAFVGQVVGGDLLLAFDGSGVLPSPGDDYVIEDIPTVIEVAGNTALVSEGGGKVVFRDLDIVSPPAATVILGFADFVLQMLATRLRPDFGGSLFLGSIRGPLEASTLYLNTTAVPSTAGIGVYPGASAGFARDGRGLVNDEVGGSVFWGACQYGGGFGLRSCYALSVGLGVQFTAGAGPVTAPSSIFNSWFDCEGLPAPDGLAIMWATASTGLQLNGVRSSAGPASAALYANDGGVVQAANVDLAGCQKALLAGRGGSLFLAGATTVSGGGGSAVAEVREGGAITASQDLAVTASSGSAVSVRGGSLTVAGGLTATAADSDCVLLDGGATLRCPGNGTNLLAIHSAPTAAAGVRVRGGSLVAAWDLTVPGGGLSTTGVSVESGSCLQASGSIQLAALGTGLSIQQGRVDCRGSISISPGAGVGVDIAGGSLSADTVTSDLAAGFGIQISGGRLDVFDVCYANNCSNAGIVAVASDIRVSTLLQAEGGLVGASLSGSRLWAGDIRAGSPSTGTGLGLDLFASTVGVRAGGNIVASSSSGSRTTGIQAAGSLVEAPTITSSACLGDGIALTESALRGTIVADNNQGNGVTARASRIAASRRSSASGNASAGIAATEQSSVTASIDLVGNGLAGVSVESLSTLVLEDRSDVSRNGREGVQVGSGGSCVVRSADINRNALAGVSVGTLGSLVLEGRSDVNSNGAAGVYVDRGGSCVIRDTDVSRNGTSGVQLEWGGQAVLEDTLTSSAPNGVYGLEVRIGSKAVAAKGSTITGSAGDVGLGTTGPVTWATLIGQVPATSTDLFNPTTEQCGVAIAN